MGCAKRQPPATRVVTSSTPKEIYDNQKRFPKKARDADHTFMYTQAPPCHKNVTTHKRGAAQQFFAEAVDASGRGCYNNARSGRTGYVAGGQDRVFKYNLIHK